MKKLLMLAVVMAVIGIVAVSMADTRRSHPTDALGCAMFIKAADRGIVCSIYPECCETDDSAQDVSGQDDVGEQSRYSIHVDEKMIACRTNNCATKQGEEYAQCLAECGFETKSSGSTFEGKR